MKLNTKNLASGLNRWLEENTDKDSKMVIAVTGKMAAGKNYVCSLLEKDGWKAVDADLLVHKAIEQCSQTIIEAFRQPAAEQNIIITGPDGKIDRRSLGRLLFAKPELLAKQEAIVYPAITKMADEFIQNNSKTIINATVLYKTPALLNQCACVIFVTATFTNRFFRARKRDRLPVKQILRRFKSQKKLLSNYRHSNKPVIIVEN